LVVGYVREPADPDTRVREIVIFTAADLFVLEGLENGLAAHIISGIPFPWHADMDPMLLMLMRVFPTGVLQATIGVMHQSMPRPSLGQRHWQRPQLGRRPREWASRAVEALVGFSVHAALQVEKGFGDGALSWVTDPVQQEGAGPAGEVGLTPFAAVGWTS
jgi:hypothetical protein